MGMNTVLLDINNVYSDIVGRINLLSALPDINLLDEWDVRP